ncbi:MAG TPA: hypothetical protein VGM97_12400 [Steroidobacteraceae bacterium]
MITRNTGMTAAVVILLLGPALAAADCGVARSTFKEGEVMCLSHRAARCGPTGAWTRLPERCGADNVVRRKPMPTQATPDAAAPPADTAKPHTPGATPASATPTGN